MNTAIQKVFANINVTKTTNQLQKLVLRKTVAPQTSRDDILQQAVSESNVASFTTAQEIPIETRTVKVLLSAFIQIVKTEPCLNYSLPTATGKVPARTK